MIAVGAAIVAGCATGANPPPELNTSSPAEAASPIPAVKNPRDVAAFARRPCELLTAQQAAQFKLDLPPKEFDAYLGDVGCAWLSMTREREAVRSVHISTFTNNPTLEVAYNKDRNRPSFELTEVSGYPAIVSRTNADLPICDIDVKPAERQSFSLTYEAKEFDNNPQQSCELAKQVAAAVLMNLPPKS
ncbi:MAG TPA: DUF3558 domain-containing protein [Pseudonocardiaceae bacterium]|nr:DUF3558 domain-containing protein [Pseudonocardiaceae bacterium]